MTTDSRTAAEEPPAKKWKFLVAKQRVEVSACNIIDCAQLELLQYLIEIRNSAIATDPLNF